MYSKETVSIGGRYWKSFVYYQKKYILGNLNLEIIEEINLLVPLKLLLLECTLFCDG